MENTNNFFARVYNIVADIPEGYVMTYGQIALVLGCPGSARVVGWAMRAAPAGQGIPCHRVVNKKGELAPEYVFGSGDCQREILLNEGVTFLKDGRIDMLRHLCTGEDNYDSY